MLTQNNDGIVGWCRYKHSVLYNLSTIIFDVCDENVVKKTF